MRILFLTVLAAVLLSAGNAFPEEAVPPIKKDCRTCHISHDMGAGVLLKMPLSDLCIDCHSDRLPPYDHMVDIVPSMPVKNLPLDREGRMTCITCHDPHGKSGLVRMLRAKPRDICKYCHQM
jgi:predicted CXXCH cytochrome family protein